MEKEPKIKKIKILGTSFSIDPKYEEKAQEYVKTKENCKFVTYTSRKS